MSKLLKEKRRHELISLFALIAERKTALRNQMQDLNAETDALIAQATEADVFTAAELKEISDLKKDA